MNFSDNFSAYTKEAEVDTTVVVRIYRTLLIVQWMENLLNLILSIYFINRINKTALIHPNLRVLLIWSLVIPFALLMVVRMVRQVNESEWGMSIKSRLMTNLVCLAARFVQDTVTPACGLPILLLSLERFLATIFRKSYAVYGKMFGVILNVIMYCALAVFSASLITFDLRTYDIVHEWRSCNSDDLHPTLLIVLYLGATCCCCLGSLLIITLYKWNSWMMAHSLDANLQTRYQYKENIATMRAIMPGFVPFGVLVFCGSLVGIFTMHHYDIQLRTTNANVLLNIQIMYMITDSYAIGFKLLFLCQFPPLRYRLMHDICRLFCVESTQVIPSFSAPAFERGDNRAAAEIYFTQLNDRWRGNIK